MRGLGLVTSRLVSPGVPFSTKNAETSLSPVLAITMYKSETPPPEINILEPFRTKSPSGVSVALVFMDMASEPELGSVRQYDENMSNRQRAGQYSGV